MTLRSKVLLVLTMTSLAGCPNPTSEPDAGAVDAQASPPRPCSTSESCDDGVFCNGEERCVEGACVDGTPLRCNDGIACTSEFCSEETRGCVVRAVDEDRDGHAASTCLDARGMALGDDCDDTRATVYPGALELCDAANVDEDCDPTTRGGVDMDGDGFEDARCCNGTSCGDDCNDAVRGASPMGTEVCNRIDDDCDGNIDEGVSVAGFYDMDGDGRGNAARPRTACGGSAQFSTFGDDCDDNNSLRSPILPEVCDGQDNDCIGVGDEGARAATWYLDRDGDGFGGAVESRFSCARPTAEVGSYVLLGTDCDDASAANNPAQAERCDGVDNDCNGVADFVLAPGDLEDDDRDGIADFACTPTPGADCDDRNAQSGLGRTEVCDGRDNDCDGMIDEGVSSYAFYRDGDGDGFGSAASGVVVACAPPTGYARRGDDCSDLIATRYPGAPETCNGFDDDCDGTDDDVASGATLCAPSGNVSFACVRGTCRTSGCILGRGECDGNPATVCEADTTAPATCGLSCSVCEFSQGCDGSGCTPRLSRGFMLNTSQADVVDVVPLRGAGPESTDAFVAVNLEGTTNFGFSGGVPFTVGVPTEGVRGAVLRVRRNGEVTSALQVTAPGSVRSLASSATHLYVLGTFFGQPASFGALGSLPAPAADSVTTYIAAIDIASGATTWVAHFSGDVHPTDIARASDGTLGITGTYRGPLMMGDAALVTASTQKAFVATLSSTGSGFRTAFSSARTIGGSGTFRAEAITALDNEFFIAGNVDGTVDLSAGGMWDGEGICAFVARYTVTGGVEDGFFYQSGGGPTSERSFRDITTVLDELVVVGDVTTLGKSSQIIPLRISFPRTLTPIAPIFAPDPNARPRFDRVASRGAEVIHAGTVDDAYEGIIPNPPDYAGAIFFGSSDGMSLLTQGRVFSVNGPSVAHALAIDPDDGAIWLGGILNQAGEPPGRVDLTLDGLTVNADPYAGFLFLFTR